MFDVCHTTNYNVWSLHNLQARFGEIDVCKPFKVDKINGTFLEVVRYAQRYFNTANVNLKECWSEVLMLQMEAWQPDFLLVEISFYAPFSNATLERFFSYINIVKSTSRTRLTNDNLGNALRIRASGVSMERFHNEQTSK